MTQVTLDLNNKNNMDALTKLVSEDVRGIEIEYQSYMYSGISLRFFVKNNEFRSLVIMRIFKDDFHTRKILDRLELWNISNSFLLFY